MHLGIFFKLLGGTEHFSVILFTEDSHKQNNVLHLIYITNVYGSLNKK